MNFTDVSEREPRDILIVEDSPTQTEWLKYLLERNGYRFSSARSGREALELVQASRPDLVISDIVMPEMDGYELCSKIKQNPSLKNIPVILLTALTDPIDVMQGLECGADNFVFKPYNEAHLLARIAYILANRQLREGEVAQMGLDIVFSNRRFSITSDRLQILNLLLSTYDEAVKQNQELKETRDRLRGTNEELEARVRERTAAQAATETKYRQLVEHSLVGIYIIQEDRFAYVNPRMEEIFGYTAAELGARPVRNFIHPEDWPQAAENLRRRLSGEIESVRYSLRMLHRDGHQIDAEVFGGRSEFDGRPAVMGTLLDVSETRTAEQARRASEERFRELAETIDDVFWCTSPDYLQILYISPAYERIWGRSREELQSDPLAWQKAIEPADLDHVRAGLEKLSRSGLYDLEYRIRRPDQTLRWIHARGFAVRGADGGPLRLVRVATDITRRKEAESAFQQRAAELERFHESSVGREMQMVELKKEVNELARQLGRPPPYDLAFLEEETPKTKA